MTELLFVVGHPTQFEAPFFAYISKVAGEEELVVLFSEADQVETITDRELARAIDWGFDLRAGYVSLVAPAGAGLGRGLAPGLASRVTGASEAASGRVSWMEIWPSASLRITEPTNRQEQATITWSCKWPSR